MGRINPEMRRVVKEQRLCFAATIYEDGTVNLSPKGTLTVLDDDHLMFADLASPQTVHGPVERLTHTVMSNTSEGARPFTEHLDDLLTR